ncbi:MAG TPA: carboxymuconolactone decarboxylase family protein [Pyrinomonadaceae bacterium]|nr:carboxymuconolactone decarboxylase family protein [Pyrinomonadaceae bacterium]
MNELIPRLSYSELDPQLAELLRPKVERLNYLGEFFQCTGHQPRALISFHRLTEDLRAALPDNLTELVALTVAAKMNNVYERVQHERLALKLGFSEAWIREVISLKAKPGSELSATELQAQQLALVVLERQGHETDTELEAVVKAIGYEQSVAVLMLIGRYVMHALIANCLALKPPVTSPLGNTV